MLCQLARFYWVQKRKKKLKADIPLKIILVLKKVDRPLIAHHIAKSAKIRPQLVDYHLKKLVKQGVVLVQEEFGHFYYYLQPSFYLEEAETALMATLMPWIEEFVKQTEFTEDMEDTHEQIVYNNLRQYFQIFLKEAQKKEKPPKEV